MFLDLFKKKVVCHLYDNISGWKEVKTSIKYSKNDKMWFLYLGKEKIPAPENIFNLAINGRLFLVRKGPNYYTFLDLNNPIDFKEIKEVDVPPSELYTQLVKATMRLERMKGMLEKFIPIIMVVIALIAVGIFIAIVWNSVAGSLSEISKNFATAMERLAEIEKAKNMTVPVR